MTHPSLDRLEAMADGRVRDEPARAHADRCLACRRALGSLGKSLPEKPATRLRLRLVALGAVATIAFALLATDRSLSFGFLEIFEPRTIAFVPMTAADFSEFGRGQAFAAFGNGKELVASRRLERSDVASAQALAGYHLRLPAAVADPKGGTFAITTPMLESFTFDEIKARQAALTEHTAYAPMPPGMDGSEIRIATGTSVSAFYGGLPATASTSASHSYDVTMHVNRSSSRTWTRATRMNMQHLDRVFVVQMPTPKVGSTGVPMATIERYFMTQPGVPKRLAAALAALRDPSTTLPIPVPADKMYAVPTRIDGVWGTCVGDDTGLGATCLWTRENMFYAVGGTRPLSEIVTIADSLT